MKAKTRLEIVWEMHEITTISFKGTSSSMLFCQSCQTETGYLSVAELVVIAEMSEAEISRLVKSGLIHLIERADGKLCVCTKSEFFKENK